MSQDDTSIALSKDIGEDDTAVFSREGDSFFWLADPKEKEKGYCRVKEEHLDRLPGSLKVENSKLGEQLIPRFDIFDKLSRHRCGGCHFYLQSHSRASALFRRVRKTQGGSFTALQVSTFLNWLSTKRPEMISNGVAISSGVPTLESQHLQFAEIVEQYQQKIYFLALDLTGNHHNAEDLSQEAFVRAYKAIDRFRGDAKITTWLYRIVVNTHIDRMRRGSTIAMSRQSSLDQDEEGGFLPEPGPHGSPERLAESNQIQEHIDRALNSLTARQRTVFVLRHYHHLKLREIAETLDLSQGTIKTTLFRAIQRLRQVLVAFAPSQDVKEGS